MAPRSGFVVYSSINGQPVARSKMSKDRVSFGNSRDKASSVIF